MRAAMLWMAKHIALAWLLILAWPLYWSIDRNPPLSINGRITAPRVIPGGTALLEIPVMRETWRNCSTQFRKYLTDSKGEEFDYGIEQVISADSLMDMERRAGPWIKTSIHIPLTTSAGFANLAIDASFVCNPIHRIWPIRSILNIPIVVLPAT